MVSVIIPSYGGDKNITRAIDSVLAQTYPDVEIIVVDDNGLGTENQIKTANYLKEYIDSNKIKYIPHEINKKGSAARNTGFKASIGEYIALLDDDDEYTPDRLMLQTQYLEKNKDCGMCYCSYRRLNKNNELMVEIEAKKSGNMLYDVLMHKPTLTSGSLLIKREVWEDMNGFDESFSRHQDWEFTTRIAEKYLICAMPEVGLLKHMEGRNNPKDLKVYGDNRRKYIDKVMPQIMTLSPSVQKRVLAENFYEVTLKYLQRKDIKNFIKEYKKVGLGWYGIEFFLRRLKIIILKNTAHKF